MRRPNKAQNDARIGTILSESYLAGNGKQNYYNGLYTTQPIPIRAEKKIRAELVFFMSC